MSGRVLCLIGCIVALILAALNVDVHVVDRLGVILVAGVFYVLAQVIV